MTRLIGFRSFMCATIVVVGALSGPVSPAEPLRLLDAAEPINDSAPGDHIEIIRQVVTAMGKEVSFEALPSRRAWDMIVRGERDGLTAVFHTNERERVCSFPNEPLLVESSYLFVRTADAGKLKFSSFDDLIGHDVAVSGPYPLGSSEFQRLSPELFKFLSEHHNLIETRGTAESLSMLVAGRVDYAVIGIRLAKRVILMAGLSGMVEPLMSHRVIEQDVYVCFTKDRVEPTFIDAFSRTLKEFKQTDAYRAILVKYSP